jgi:hypothetical protein
MIRGCPVAGARGVRGDLSRAAACGKGCLSLAVVSDVLEVEDLDVLDISACQLESGETFCLRMS